MASLRSAASDFNSARCLGVNRLEAPFFIGFPFISGSLPSADDTADWLGFFRFVGPSMNNQQYDRPHESDGVPAITVRVWVRPRQVERIVKHQHRGFERQAMLGAICYRDPTSNALPLRGCSYKYDVTGVKILSRRSSVAGLRGSAIGGILANARFGDVSGTTVEVLAIVPKSEAESWLAQFGNPE